METKATSSLTPLVRGYLESACFNILREEGNLLVADKLGWADDRDTRLVWTVPSDQERAETERWLRDSIPQNRTKYPDARITVLSESRAGFSREFIQWLAEANVKLLVPIQFFDAQFKHEDAPKAVSAIRSIREQAKAERRVLQPFRVDGEDVQGDDLFDALKNEFEQSHEAAIRIIVGRAGIGKSFLFREVFSRLYDEFQDHKARHGKKPRPIPLLPEHLKGTHALRTEALVENFLRTDVASPVSRETFEWLVINGFAVWLLDGLDELYAGDPNFFFYIQDLLTRPNSTAQITIWCRDSLLTTSDPFAEFRELCGNGKPLKIYRLLDWERPSKRQFAWFNFESRLPACDETDTEQVASFLQTIERTPILKSLSSLPFYCKLLLDQFSDGDLQDFLDDVSMLSHVVDRMIDREVQKGLLDMSLFEPNGLNTWLEQLAVDYIDDYRFSGIRRTAAMEYGEVVLRRGLDEGKKDNILTSLVQFPLFRAGSETGLIAFTHDLIAEILAARFYLRLLRGQQVAEVARRISRVDLDDPTLLRFMARDFRTKEEQAVIDGLRQGDIHGRGLVALVSLLMLVRPERDLIKRIGLNLERQNLVTIRFKDRDLSEISFRGSDLSHVTFANSDLRCTRFEGAFFYRTRFEGDTNLKGAHFGDLSRIQSIYVDKKYLEEPRRIKEWISKVTGQPEAPGEPCPTALQMAHLFGKFITPLGEPRRHNLRRQGVLAGKKYEGAAEVETCLREAIRRGYLSEPDERDRFRRTEGDKYSEMVEFVRDGKISDGLGSLISALCCRRGCLHRLHA